MSPVTYEEATSRNAGFLTDAEQRRLRESRVFVCGVGGMGGAAVHSLVRAGVGRLAIADFDVFEATNLNRQLFATAETIGRSKVDATVEGLLRINPGLEIVTYGADWVDRLDEILPGSDVVVNAMDDARAAIRLYRAARRHPTTVVDAWTSPHPSVTCVAPDDPRPEEWLGFPTVGVADDALDEAMLAEALLAELSFVAAVSRGISRLDPRIVAEILRGERPRSSFAPIVLVAGNLMAFEAIGALLGRPSGAGPRGYFVDPWTGTVERPGPAPLVALRRRFTLRRLRSAAGVAA